VSSVNEQRTHPRMRVNWHVVYNGTSDTEEVIHESSRLEDYSLSGACFLTMSDIRVGMHLTLQISVPMARPLVFLGEVVRVDDKSDVGRMFKIAAVRWLPTAQMSKPAEEFSSHLA
jgi:hypothetical protein